MKIFRLFRNKKDLRERCIEKYGDDFAAIYDSLGSGIPVGNLEETKIVCSMIEAVKKEESLQRQRGGAMLKKVIGWLILAALFVLFAAAEIHNIGFTMFIIALVLTIIFGSLITFAVYLIIGGNEEKDA